MGGIAGIVGHPQLDLVHAMTDSLAHRGPDGQGFFYDADVALGYRHLDTGKAAFYDSDRSSKENRFLIVFSGFLVNLPDIRKDLERAGVVIEGDTVSDILCAAYKHWREDCLCHFRGMFSLALWDCLEQQLFLARDQIGTQPLYYARTKNGILFASEIKALLLCPDIDTDLDLESLDDYLTYLYTVPPKTLFRGISQLPPGYSLSWRKGEFTVHRYWKPPCKNTDVQRSEDELVEEIDERLGRLIRLYGTVSKPVGAFLSGGLDSAAITHYLRGDHSDVKTFTLGFGAEGEAYDEREEARKLAAFMGTDHHEIQVSSSLADLLPSMVDHFDEAFGNPTALLSWRISAYARQHCSVILSGDGGDEAFGGYPRYQGMLWLQYYRRIPLWLREKIIYPVAQRLPESVSGFHALRRIRQFTSNTGLDPIDSYARWVGCFTPSERQSLYSETLSNALAGRDAYTYLKDLAQGCDCEDLCTTIMAVDVLSFLPNNVLQYGDRMSRAHSLEVRSPLADPEFLSFMLAIPTAFKLKKGKDKYLLRKLMSGYLPPEAAKGVKKGFNPPMGSWLNEGLRGLVDQFLAPEKLKRAGLFNPSYVQKMLEDHRNKKKDNTWHLWALIVFEQWRQRYFK
ncbi:MAG: asparagine synthase (glutamine-hydrolyzing) [Candidatus Hydrogenedentales bacterium]|jgi:asparagine synthase (glutamine-hydrolysing)